jgi:origin recognition complex subunit 3
MKRSNSSANDDNQKTHYFIDTKRKKTGKSSVFDTIFNCLSENDSKQLIHRSHPFVTLLNGKEPEEHVQLRYDLYDTIWNYQLNKIQIILNQVNVELFQQLNEFIHKQAKDHLASKLAIGFLQLSSNTANNLRILSQFNQYIVSTNKQHKYKIINLSSKYCSNIKMASREIIRQFLDSSYDSIKIEDEYEQEEPVESDDELEAEEDEKTTGEKDDETTTLGEDDLIQGRVNFDMDIVEDWYKRQKQSIKVILVIQDSNSVSNLVLNQIIKLIHSYCQTIPFKVIMGLSTNNISNWINNNFNSEIRMLTNGFKFKCMDNSNLGFRILDDLFLTYNREENHLPLFLLDSKLSTILLNRFENSNNSIDALISQIKLCYMIHFYQSPLSVLIENTIDIDIKENSQYLDAIKKLPSFKKHIEYELYNEDKNNETGYAEKIVDLLSKDEVIISKFYQSKWNFNQYKQIIINVINIIDDLQEILDIVSFQPKFTVYDLIINGKFLNSGLLNSIFKAIGELTDIQIVKLIENLTYLIQNGKLVIDVEDDQTGEPIVDTNLQQFIKMLPEVKHNKDFIKHLQHYLNSEYLFKSIDQYLFHEIFTLKGGELHQTTKLPENIENIMINLIRPNLRLSIEQGLDNANSYLKNELITTHKFKVQPTLTELFKVYKEAPVTINIYDFYTTFRQSLNKPEIENAIQQQFDESEWNKVTYGWFIQNCFELMMMGFLKEKPKGDVLEKSTWIGV